MFVRCSLIAASCVDSRSSASVLLLLGGHETSSLSFVYYDWLRSENEGLDTGYKMFTDDV